MFEGEKAKLEILLGERYFIIDGYYNSTSMKERNEKVDPVRHEFGSKVGDPLTRYSFEYTGHYYESYKPGIDDSPRIREFPSILEIGGGPAYLARQAPEGRRFCQDIVKHPDLDILGVTYLSQGICDPRFMDVTKDKTKNGLIVLSYCLDRVPNQMTAIERFAWLVKSKKGTGLITVCLPAIPTSPGIENFSYAEPGGWFTLGDDPIVLGVEPPRRLFPALVGRAGVGDQHKAVIGDRDVALVHPRDADRHVRPP